MDSKILGLKIKIYQPQAHYRIPFTYQRRHTYPIPPYSTALGLIANILGIRNVPGQEEPCIKENCDCSYHKLKQIKIGICGKFQSKSTEYVWLRNLSRKAHIGRFGSVENRFVSGHIEHIGGQSPCFIDILNDVQILIYLYHSNDAFLDEIKQRFENPTNRSSPLHLGRAEDWIVIRELEKVEFEAKEINGNYGYFFWIPEKIFNSVEFEKINGLTYNLTTFYKIKDGARNFDYIRVKLNDGDLGDVSTYFDDKEKVPIFLADLKGD
ncbi:MAG: type I-B CRISPR-associated protein Cas5b [Dictyoglomaceae bacterium]|nr:type I-B CRISPR-associated protein Cas5b [Dictyoglomaceae bacterium]HPU43436.1 type I-B CRISPR-associated protein Cas5b [Dictyoglomaceae bacterium]